VAEIDRLNIRRATHLAMCRAVAALAAPPDHVLVDGLPVTDLPCPSTAIVGGDAKSLSIAAASVAAKIARDRFMVELDRLYPAYGFARHKGYGTSYHIRALFEYGPSPVHRCSFRPVREAAEIRRRQGQP
jgi:ribonuclease HII